MEEQKIKDCLKNLINLAEAISPLLGECSVRGSSVQMALEELVCNFDNCLFKVGDKVKLNTTPIIDNYTNWGWLAHKHFLIEGSTAIIESRGIHNGKFRYGVSFDNESYIDFNTKEKVFITLDKKRIFTIPESWLTKSEL